MAITPIKVLLFLLGGTVAGGGTAYLAGVFDPAMPPANVAGATDPAAKGDRPVPSSPPADAAPAKPAAEPMTPPKVEGAADPAQPQDPATPPVADAPPPATVDPGKPATAEATPPATTEKATPPAVGADEVAAGPPENPAKVEPDPKIAAVEPGEGKPATTTEPPAARTPPAQTAPKQPAVLPPGFDLMRVEADGSIVIAGHAAANAKVEAIIGSRVIGSAVAGPEGDFAIVLDDPLKPGDYQIVLRATGPDGVAAMSQETAVVSIPETSDGQVLALVQAPGKAAELITVPQPDKAPPAVAAAEPAPADTVEAPGADDAAAPADTPAAPATSAAPTPPDSGKPADQQVASAPPAAPADATPPQQAASDVGISVEAVEIEGRRIFIAGMADAGVRVRAYANDILLGEALTSQAKRFLIEAERDLPVGDYIIRVDALAADGVKVVARAAVPFQREPGENLAAVAPPAPAEAPKAEPPANGKMAAADGAGDPEKTQPPAVADDAAKPAEPNAPAEAAAVPAAPGADAAGASQPADAAPAPGGDAAAVAQPPATTEPPGGADTAPATPPATDSAAATPPAGETPDVQPPADPAAAQAPTVPAGSVEPPATDAAAAEPPSNGVVAAPGEILSPKLQAVNGSVIIRRGDSLWRISRRVYGRGVRYSTIYLANQPQISDPNRIYPGQVFGVPMKTTEGEDADMGKLGEQAVEAAPGTPAMTQQ